MGSDELIANLFRISQTEKLLEKQLKKLVELCQKIGLHLKRV